MTIIEVDAPQKLQGHACRIELRVTWHIWYKSPARRMQDDGAHVNHWLRVWKMNPYIPHIYGAFQHSKESD